LAQLPPRPGYEWLAVDRDILLVVAATEIIVGILRDVL
jgi:Ni/Co efflux regulator RcnB